MNIITIPAVAPVNGEKFWAPLSLVNIKIPNVAEEAGEKDVLLIKFPTDDFDVIREEIAKLGYVHAPAPYVMGILERADLPQYVVTLDPANKFEYYSPHDKNSDDWPSGEWDTVYFSISNKKKGKWAGKIAWFVGEGRPHPGWYYAVVRP